MNKIKTILLDADGLLLKKSSYFSEIYSKEYGVPTEDIVPFFKTKFRDCQKGIDDVKEELVPFLKQWNWNGTVDDFLRYWFSSCTKIDEDVLKIVQDLRKKRGIKCYLATDQEKYRAEYIKKDLGLEKYLDGFFFSHELGYSKSEIEFFEEILKQLNLNPDEVMFWDDENENIQIASQIGIMAKYYESRDQLRDAFLI